MKANTATAVTTGTIAITTVIGLMVGFYYNLKSSGINMIYIVVWELILVVVILSITYWIRRNITNENKG